MWATKVHRRLGTMMLRVTCVISFYYGSSYTHCRKSSLPSFRGCEETRRFYTETLLHTDAFTHSSFYTQTLLHRDAFTRTKTFTHRRFYTRTLLHTDPFTHILFYTQTLLHIKAFTHRSSYTQTLLQTDVFTHRPFYTQTHLHAEAFTPRRFSTQKLLLTDSCTHRRSYRQNPLHTGAFTGRRFYNTYQHDMMLWNRSETSWLGSANLSAQDSAGQIPIIWFTSRPKTPSKTQAGTKLAQEPPRKFKIARSCIVVHSYQDEMVCHRVGSHMHVDQHFPPFELPVALMSWKRPACRSPHMFVKNSLYRPDKQQLATDFAGSPRTVSQDNQWCKLIFVRCTDFRPARIG